MGKQRMEFLLQTYFKTPRQSKTGQVGGNQRKKVKRKTDSCCRLHHVVYLSYPLTNWMLESVLTNSHEIEEREVWGKKRTREDSYQNSQWTLN